MEEKQREVQWREGGKRRGGSSGKRVHLIVAFALEEKLGSEDLVLFGGYICGVH